MKYIVKNLLITFIFLLYVDLCFSQNPKTESIKFNRKPFSIRVSNQFSKLHFKLTMLTISDYISQSKYRESSYYRCFSSITSKDSIVITLNSGVSWELLGDQPKLPLFFFFRRNNQEVEEGINFTIFKGECEARDKLPYEMISKFDVYIDIINDKQEKCSTLIYEITPDSTGEMEIKNKLILNNELIFKPPAKRSLP